MRHLTTKRLALLAVLVLAVTAGCLGGGDSDPGPAENTTDGTQDPSIDVPRVGELDPVEGSVSGDELLGNSVSELDAIQQYSFKKVTTQGGQGNASGAERTLEATVDEVNQETAAFLTQPSQGQTTEQPVYLVDGFAHRISEDINVQTDSKWVKGDVSDNIEDILARYDMTGEVGAIFGNATATVEGEGTYQGERVYVLSIDIDEQAMGEYYGLTENNSTSFNSIEGTAWISADSNLPLRFEQTSNSALPGGSTATVDDTITFDYDAGTVTLPDEAGDAPTFSELQNQTGN